MNSRARRISLSLFLCTALLPMPQVSFVVSEAAQDQRTDRQVASALSNMGYAGLPVRMKGESDRDFIGRNSTFFSNILKTKCPTL